MQKEGLTPLCTCICDGIDLTTFTLLPSQKVLSLDAGVGC